VDIGFLNAEEKEWLKAGELKWKEVTQKAVDADSSDEM
jgi:hypothetical protein